MTNGSPYLGRYVVQTDIYIPAVARESLLCASCAGDIIAGEAYALHVVQPMVVRFVCKDCARKAEERKKV